MVLECIHVLVKKTMSSLSPVMNSIAMLDQLDVELLHDIRRQDRAREFISEAKTYESPAQVMRQVEPAFAVLGVEGAMVA